LNKDKGLNTALIIMGILVAGIGIAMGIRAIVRKKRNPLSGGTDADEFWYKTIYGVIAHELEEVLPQAVTGKKDAEQMQSVDYSKIVPLLVKSIQELKKEIYNLKLNKNGKDKN